MNKSKIYSVLSEHQEIIDIVGRSLLNVNEDSYTFASARINDGVVVTYKPQSNIPSLPPIVLHVYTYADQEIMTNAIDYCTQLYQQCKQTPVLLFIFSNNVPTSISNLFIPYPGHSHVFYLPNTLWASKCLLISGQEVKQYIQEDEDLNELVALVIFLLYNEREIKALRKFQDPTIKYLCSTVNWSSQTFG